MGTELRLVAGWGLYWYTHRSDDLPANHFSLQSLVVEPLNITNHILEEVYLWSSSFWSGEVARHDGAAATLNAIPV